MEASLATVGDITVGNNLFLGCDGAPLPPGYAFPFYPSGSLEDLAGNATINKATLTWEPNAPPKNWKAMVSRWERLDTLRTWAALAAFGLFLAAMARR